MDRSVPGPLLKLKGLWRVDGVSQANWDGKCLKAGVVLSELNPDVADYYSAEARQPKDPERIVLNPHWLSDLTVGSIWREGKKVYKPAPLPDIYQIDTRKAEVHPFDRGVRLGEKYTENGIADPDFLDRSIHRDLIASPYVLAPIQADKQYKWMVIPCSELLRFYMGRERRLIARVLRGELDSLVEKVVVEGGTVTIYENVELTRTEAIILARAYVDEENYLNEMQMVFQRLRRTSINNQNSKSRAALSIEVTFPIKGITNLSISGVPMSLAGGKDNALFAMEIFSCTFPSGYSKIIIERANDLGKGGNKKVQGRAPTFVPQEDDDLDDVILDEPSDSRIPKRSESRYEALFPWSESITLEYRHNNTARDWRTVSPRVNVDVDAYALDEDSNEIAHRGNQGVSDTLTNPPPPAIKLSEFIKILPEIVKAFKGKWSLCTIIVNDTIESPNKNYALTNFPKIKGRRWKWHLVDTKNNGKISTTRRQLACIEIECGIGSGRYFYILEMEFKTDAHCTALLREKNFKKLDTITINEFLEATTYNNGWPEFDQPIRVKDTATKTASELYSKCRLVVGKSKHPQNREKWADSLLADIRKWLEGSLKG
ncbi:hypothetical protein [Pseudomonas nitroreducens]|uniref:hypothetical protein n=1 Tax=Pseudomonas nitroreducens TaxID=46680 RepID=UPI001FB819FC|nr:hypothetical protein [Pseudomonas nitroreducens]MCJ1880686.1 hypothetical protein [Pseudomonas nitroreducens]MCJ1894002.1 hypothetical protein [Pseudomonas nitroreducens]HBN8384864.1 hypothetical protein [Pseudomonas aeruginosa]